MTLKELAKCLIPKHNNVRSMTAKVIKSGDLIELYEYTTPMLYGYTSSSRGARAKPEDWHGKDERDLSRARNALRRTITANENQYSKFLTLTYAETMLDIKKLDRDIQTFMQAMRRDGFNLKYLYVIEHQKARGEKEGNEGTLHAHIVIFNDQYIPKEIINKRWKHGIIKINRIKDIRNLGAYVSKYLTKEVYAEYSSKSYRVSKGLKKPEEIRIAPELESAVESIEQSIKPTYQHTYSISYPDSEGNIQEKATVHYTQGRLIKTE